MRYFQTHFLAWFLFYFDWILKFIHSGPVNRKPELLQIMAWHRAGDKSISEAIMAYFTDAYVHLSDSMDHILNQWKNIKV